ncbi:ABC transporter permease [Marinoscillum sp.]|uniref:ABC transporter permease n=1 Tax=Marinoscillum sp. TaxID=2024838 RepID=UPI003BA9F56D
MGSKNIRWAEKLLTQVIDEQWLEDILGDLEEYLYDLQELPSWKRNLYFWFHVLCCLRPSLLKPLYQPNSTIFSMLKFNTKLAIRSAIKHPGLSGASVLTLILGALCFQLIFSWIANERSMNKMHSTYDQLYITAVKTNPNADLTSISLQTMFRLDYEQFPEIIAASQIHVYQKDEIKLSTASHDHKGKALVVDSTFLQMLDFDIIAGNDEVLYDPSSIAITQQMAERMFSGKNAIGQTVQLSCDQQGTYQIAAIIEDIPSSSSIDFDFLVPRHSQAFWRRIPQEIVLTKPDLDKVAFNERIKTLGRATNTRFPESELYFIPLRKCYEDSIISASLFNKYGNSTTIQILTLIAAMIWLITMFGFNNLQLTLQLSIAKNLGIQHIIGGSKRDINSEMILGRVLFLLIGLSASLLIYQGLFPVISRFLEIAIDQSIGVELLGMGLFLSSVILISILTGTIHLIRLNPARALHNGASLKIPLQQKVLTTTQYVITTILIIGTCVVYLQFDYMLSTDLGLKHTDVYSVDFYEMSSASDEAHNVSYLRNQLNSFPSIAYYAQGDLPIGTKVNATS